MKNPQCTANAISAVHNVRMSEVAKREGAPITFGQSPFALARGQTFERSLFREQGKTMLEALHKARVLPGGSRGLCRLSPADERRQAAQSRRRTASDQATPQSAAKASTPAALAALPAVLAGPVVRIPGGLMLPEAILVIDAMAVQIEGDRPRLVVGEVKTYPDRAVFTDAGELATARAQAGVYVHGLRPVLADLGLTDALPVSDEGFLVLTRPGFNRPSVRAGESLQYQAQRAERGFAKLRVVAAELGGSTDPDIVIPRIQAAPTSYCESCLSFCDRAPVCHKAALASGDPTVLGDEVAHFLGATTLHRALELMGGAAPANEAETDLLARIAELGERNG